MAAEKKQGKPSDLLSRMHKTMGTPAPIVTTPPADLTAPEPEAPAALEPRREAKPRVKREKAVERKGAIPTPEQTTRFSLDLDPDEHRQMMVFALDHGVRGSVVGRVLVEMLNSDQSIRDRVASRLEELRKS